MQGHPQTSAASRLGWKSLWVIERKLLVARVLTPLKSPWTLSVPPQRRKDPFTDRVIPLKSLPDTLTRFPTRCPVLVKVPVESDVLASPPSLPTIKRWYSAILRGLYLKQTSYILALAQYATASLMAQISLRPLCRSRPRCEPTFGFFKTPPSRQRSRR